MLQQEIVYPCLASQKATWGFACVWVEMWRKEVCASFEQENFCAWGTWKGVALPLEKSVLRES